MQTTTSPNAPYDALRPLRCRAETDGRKCNGRSNDINWAVPDVHGFRCRKCGAYNVVLIIEASEGTDVG